MSIFRRDRAPEQWWVDALAHIAPANAKIPWLLLHWEPGETWCPVQRWLIREMDPAIQYCTHLEFYEGPNPRTQGRWVGTGEERRWKSSAMISERQWKLFRRYRCTSRRVWVVQGPNGGHPFELSQAERMWKKAVGLDDADTPAPGSLPYAEPDTRTFTRLAEYDKLTKWEQNITWDQRQETKNSAGLWVARDVNAEYRAFGKAMLDFFTDGVREAVDSVKKGTLGELYDNAPKTDAPRLDYEAIEEKFLSAAPISLEKAS
jgi:hypothetical protein